MRPPSLAGISGGFILRHSPSPSPTTVLFILDDGRDSTFASQWPPSLVILTTRKLDVIDYCLVQTCMPPN
ncbi:unnamed protein product [Victoria cruziana]